MEIPQAFLGTRESIIDAHPGTEKQITREGAFMGPAVVGGVYVCANASTYFLSENTKNKQKKNQQGSRGRKERPVNKHCPHFV